ncbi:MAG: hypothetical protein ACYC4L_04595 [Chloroflexota bacterium]
MVAEQQRQHSVPCGDVVELRQVCRGLVEDRQRQNHSIQRIEENIGELHEKFNGMALLSEREMGNLKAQLAGLSAGQQALLSALEAQRQQQNRPAAPKAPTADASPWAGVNKQMATLVVALLGVLLASANAISDLLARKP